MFGVDDFISGLVGGATKAISNQIFGDSQEKARQQQILEQQRATAQAQQFNAEQAEIGRQFAREQAQFGASQADISRQFSAQQQTQAETFNASQAELNRNFQERMSSTAYQRARADMLAAGLNPILAAGAGGASTPGGSAGSIGAVGGATASGMAGPFASTSASTVPLGPARVSALEGVISSAAEAMRLQPQIAAIRQGTRLGAAQEAREGSQEALNRSLSTESQARTSVEHAKEENVRQDTRNKEDEQSRVGIFGSTFNPEHWWRKFQQLGEEGSAREGSSSAQSFLRKVEGGPSAGAELVPHGAGDARYYSVWRK